MTDPQTRDLVSEIAGHLFTDTDRAWTMHHRIGQMTVRDYRGLDKVEPSEITGVARVRARGCPDGVFEYIGLDADGWLVRAELVAKRYRPQALGKLWAQYRALPFLRVVDDL